MTRFIAAMDHSGGSTGGVLERYGRIYTEENKMNRVHQMRMRMVNSPSFNSDSIWAAILYKDTVERGMVKILGEMGIDTFLKIDDGCKENGTLKDFDVRGMCQYAVEHDNKIYGTKMRSIITCVDMIDSVLEQQFELAHTVQEYGLMPIIEPEVPIDHKDKAIIEYFLADRLEKALQGRDWQCILKLTPPETANQYENLTDNQAVKQVVFLSGGYKLDEACWRLIHNDNVTASFSRALTEHLYHDLDNEAFDEQLSYNIEDIVEACSIEL